VKQPIRPMLATLVAKPFNQSGWVNEEKYDGIRALAFREGVEVRIWSRNLKDITADFPAIAHALGSLSSGDFVLDGEIVVFDRRGVSRFQLLQRRALSTDVQSLFAAFDCLRTDGREILKRPLTERRKALEGIVPARHPLLMRSRRLSLNGEIAYETARRKGWEGIIAKDASSLYEPGKRSKSWLKIKCRKESEFVIGGYTPPKGNRIRFGAILVGLYDGQRLRYAGKVGTGYSDRVLINLGDKMMPLRILESPFEPAPPVAQAHWIRPVLVAQIAFSEWTREGRLRQPAFLGLRDDKNPSECRWRERDQ
jgi:bifunctional non-homologous end joining protein LigD